MAMSSFTVTHGYEDDGIEEIEVIELSDDEDDGGMSQVIDIDEMTEMTVEEEVTEMNVEEEVTEMAVEEEVTEMTVEDEGTDMAVEDEGTDMTVEDEGTEEIVEDEGTEETVEDEGTEEIVEDEGTEEIVEYEGTEEIVEDEGTEETVKDEGSEMTAEDEGTEMTAEDEGTEMTAEDEGAEEASEDEGSEETVEDDGTEETVQDDGIEENVEDDGTEETVEDDGIEENVEDDGTEETVEDDGTEETVEDEGTVETAEDEGIEETVEDEGTVETDEDEGTVETAEDEGIEETVEDEGTEEQEAVEEVTEMTVENDLEEVTNNGRIKMAKIKANVSLIDLILEDNYPMDTIITLADGTLGAHRLILAAASPFLAYVLHEQDDGSKEEASLILPDISKTTMEQMLTLAYSGSIEFSDTQEAELLSAMASLFFGATYQVDIHPLPPKPKPVMTVEFEPENTMDTSDIDEPVDSNLVDGEPSPGSSNTSTNPVSIRDNLECTVCNRVFSRQAKLQKHIEMHRKKSLTRNLKPVRVFATFEQIQKFTFCNECNVQWKTFDRAQRCLVSHGLVRCWSCFEVFDKIELKSHYMLNHCDESSKLDSVNTFIRCSWCPKTINIKSSLGPLTTHSTSHIPGSHASKRRTQSMGSLETISGSESLVGSNQVRDAVDRTESQLPETATPAPSFCTRGEATDLESHSPETIEPGSEALPTGIDLYESTDVNGKPVFLKFETLKGNDTLEMEQRSDQFRTSLSPSPLKSPRKYIARPASVQKRKVQVQLILLPKNIQNKIFRRVPNPDGEVDDVYPSDATTVSSGTSEDNATLDPDPETAGTSSFARNARGRKRRFTFAKGVKRNSSTSSPRLRKRRRVSPILNLGAGESSTAVNDNVNIPLPGDPDGGKSEEKGKDPHPQAGTVDTAEPRRIFNKLNTIMRSEESAIPASASSPRSASSSRSPLSPISASTFYSPKRPWCPWI